MMYLFIWVLLLGSIASSCKFKPYNGNDRYHATAQIPLDEAPHYKNSLEWWYFTGHLNDIQTNHQYGVEYVFFHFNPRNKKDYVMVNFAISDPANQKFVYDYKIVKRKDLLTNTLPIDLTVDYKSEVWRLKGQEGYYQLQAKMVRNGDYGISLNTQPSKSILLHSGTGYEKYGDYAETGYYTYPRLNTSGILTLEGKELEVQGELWYDRQWNCVGVWQKQVAWDWISVQFENPKEELMLYLVYHKETNERIYGGTFFTENEDNIHLTNSDIKLKELDYWESPASGANYPIKWQVEIAKLGIDLTIEALIPNQELKINFTPIHKLYYWEGMCKVEGTKQGQPVYGKSYAEITNRGI